MEDVLQRRILCSGGCFAVEDVLQWRTFCSGGRYQRRMFSSGGRFAAEEHKCSTVHLICRIFLLIGMKNMFTDGVESLSSTEELTNSLVGVTNM